MERRTSTDSASGAADPVEADLLAKARGGNRFAFEEIVRRYQRRVYAVAKRVVRRHELADEVAQETFLRAWQGLDGFDLGRPFGPWICRIAANLAINHVRSPQSREQELPEGREEIAPASQGPLMGVLDREARELLEAAVADLPPEQRAVFVLRTFEDLSYTEIAAALELSPGTVMSRLSRARERLREAILPYVGRRSAGGREP